jgi:hypothetical protein
MKLSILLFLSQGHHGHDGQAHAGFSGTFFGVLIAVTIIFALCCCCCCLIPLCCPDLKTCARIQKIILRAKKSFERLRKESPPPGYDPIFGDEEEEDEAEVDGDDEDDGIVEMTLRDKRRRRKPPCIRSKIKSKKCTPKIQIPICSDTSVNICYTTEIDSDACQNGYISKEMDSAFKESGSSVEIVKEKPHHKQCAFDPVQHQQQHKSHQKYATTNRRISDDINNDIDDRYNDVAQRLQKKKLDKNITHFKDFEQESRQNSHQNKDHILSRLPPLPKQAKPEDERAIEKKNKLYDKLITDWKYKKMHPVPKSNSIDSLGPPRHHKPAW